MIKHKYILNFPNDNLRKKYMEDQLKFEEVEDYTIVEGINGYSLDTDKYNLNDNRKIFRKLKLGEIGCLLGHKKIYKEALDNNHTTILVLEDDIKLSEDFNEYLKQKLLHVPDNADIVFLSSTRIWTNKYSKNCLLKNINEDYYKLIEGHHYGTQIYLIKENAMKKILELDTITYPIDLLLCELNLNVYISKTQLATQKYGMGSYTQSSRLLNK